MEKRPEGPGPVRGLGEHYRTAQRRIRAERPRSFYLLPAMVAFLVVGAPVAQALDGPRSFFAFLAIHLLFFFIIMAVAIRDSRRIVQQYLRDQRALFRTTVGEPAFVHELGERVAARTDD